MGNWREKLERNGKRKCEKVDRVRNCKENKKKLSKNLD